ncbi:hypothetical protein BJ170DRAFT_724154 [Xylariales sp. AK1849]|nr:hypothetical protein BJ170DRAFT_724154 [Xylariales sp. AK1849]
MPEDRKEHCGDSGLRSAELDPWGLPCATKSEQHRNRCGTILDDEYRHDLQGISWRRDTCDPRWHHQQRDSDQARVEGKTEGETNKQHSQPEERKPWETLLIGASLGENLSKIEYKDRQILQQSFILEWTEKNEPGSISIQRNVLKTLIQERAEMENTDENNLPAYQVWEKTSVSERLGTLRRTLKRSLCESQSINIRAAIAGYESGKIAYSGNFTLIYAGLIVDSCPSYHSFTVNRSERLNSYLEAHGPGWLWYEPPLDGPEATVLAKKGFCLRQRSRKWVGLGPWPINMRFVVDESKVRGSERKHRQSKQTSDKSKVAGNVTEPAFRSATFKVLLDTGATFPTLGMQDLKYLGIDLKNYSTQSITTLNTANGPVDSDVYDLDVGIGSALSEERDWRRTTKTLGWPHEAGIVGGLCPVAFPRREDQGEAQDELHWADRLSGTLPFTLCYTSSVPTAGRIWLGEDRRDVLGAQRFPPYQGYGDGSGLDPIYPSKFEEQRSGLATPDGLVFVHKVPGTGSGNREFVDTDLQDQPGKTQWLDIINGQVFKKKEFGPGPDQNQRSSNSSKSFANRRKSWTIRRRDSVNDR